MLIRDSLVAFSVLVSIVAAQTAPAEAGDRVFQFANLSSVQDTHNVATIVRAIAEVRDVFVDPARRTLTIRDVTDRAALAEWLFKELDSLPAQGASGGKHEYRLPAASDDITRVFCLAHTGTVRDLQEVATVVRSISDIRRLFTSSARNAVVVRGMPGEIALVEWLVDVLDKPAGVRPKSPSYRLAGGGENLVEVFYLPEAQTASQLQEAAVKVRSTARLRRLFIYNSRKLLAVRGTDEQVALAGRLIAETKLSGN